MDLEITVLVSRARKIDVMIFFIFFFSIPLLGDGIISLLDWPSKQPALLGYH